MREKDLKRRQEEADANGGGFLDSNNNINAGMVTPDSNSLVSSEYYDPEQDATSKLRRIHISVPTGLE